jgi:DNA-binding transcriptional ArsR family regulator
MSEKCNTESISSVANGIFTVRGEELGKVAMALSSPMRVQMLHFIRDENKKGNEVDIKNLTELIKQSKANVSAHMRILERAGLVKITYKPGIRGVKKVYTADIREVGLILD